MPSLPVNKPVKTTNVKPNNKVKPESQKVAMPVETIENVKQEVMSNDGVTTPLAGVEKNLDATINVSNLTVSWEVPSGYVNNSIAKKYFTKIGKIVQLNLKTELLLLVTQPLTDKISVELEYDNSLGKFVFKKFITSSGDASVDKVIEQTIRNALNVGLNTNLAIFEDIQGAPILVIKL